MAARSAHLHSRGDRRAPADPRHEPVPDRARRHADRLRRRVVRPRRHSAGRRVRADGRRDVGVHRVHSSPAGSHAAHDRRPCTTTSTPAASRSPRCTPRRVGSTNTSATASPRASGSRCSNRRLVRLRDEYRQPPGSVRFLEGDAHEVATTLADVWQRYRRTRAGETGTDDQTCGALRPTAQPNRRGTCRPRVPRPPRRLRDLSHRRCIWNDGQPAT